MIAFVLLVALQADVVTELPIFEFKGIKAGEKVFFKGWATCDKGETPDERSCTLDDTKIANKSAITTAFLYQDRLTMLMSMYDSSDFPVMLLAFKQKYGEPCETATEKWHNRMGASLDNQVLTWCFSTGKLKLKALGYNINRGEILYIDDWKTPATGPKIDF